MGQLRLLQVFFRQIGATLDLFQRLQLRYTFDVASQLTQIQIHNGTAEVGRIDYAYDTGGRRISQSGTWARTGLPMALASTVHDANNRLTQHNGVALTHDTNGNMTALGPDTYSWNARNQLVGISGASTASFQYDALGRRVGKTVNGTATSFLHDGWQIVRETQGTEATGYLTGLALDEVYRRSTPTGSHDYLTDALGSILGLADSSQAITTSYTYEPYGGTTVQGAASTNPVQYTGRENDGTGLYYYRNRYYSPMMSRFVSEDPIGLAGGINIYAYVDGNPISRVDPTGLAFCTYSVSSGRLVCQHDAWRGGGFAGAWQFASGNNSRAGCKNNSACEGIPDIGPIPRGCYTWNGLPGSSPDRRNLSPSNTTDMFGRRGPFQTHQCAHPFGPDTGAGGAPHCSEGCVVSTRANVEALNRLIDAEPRSILCVVD